MAKPERLNNYEVFQVMAPSDIEPSGLHLKDGKLYTVCDDASNIYQLTFNQGNTATAEIIQRLNVEKLSALNLDLEGITSVGDAFFVVSEAHHKLVRVLHDEVRWVPDLGGVYADAFEQGLFQINNAGLEAVTYLGNQTFLLSVEREPRGLIEVVFDGEFKNIIQQTNQVINDSEHVLSGVRKPDLTGLFYHDGVIYALHRNAYVIHELIKNSAGIYKEGKSWSYEHIVRHPDYVYQDMKFGHAEGLAVDDEYFYLIIDNNKNPSAKDPNNNRPLLIRAKRK